MRPAGTIPTQSKQSQLLQEAACHLQHIDVQGRQLTCLAGLAVPDGYSVVACQPARRLPRGGATSEFMLGCRNMEAVRRDLEAARSEIMGPLSAASMESHSRAYPHLVQLHMLQVALCQPVYSCTCSKVAVCQPARFTSMRGQLSSQPCWWHGFFFQWGRCDFSSACCMVLLFSDAYEDEEEAVAILCCTEACFALQEIEDAAALQQGIKVGPLERQRKLRWQERLRATQPSLLTQVRLIRLQ